jgi:hypothetical protein
MRDLSRTRLRAVDPRLKTCPYETLDALFNAFEDDGNRMISESCKSWKGSCRCPG